MNIKCDECGKQVYETPPENPGITYRRDHVIVIDWSKPGADTIAWFCNDCSQMYCTKCCFTPALWDKEKGAPDILPQPKCPLCGSNNVHIPSKEDIETWDFFRPNKKKDNKNKGCMLLIAIAGFVLTVTLLFSI